MSDTDDPTEHEVPDPTEMSVRDLRETVRDIDDRIVLRQMLTQETAEDSRKTAVEALTDRIDAVVDDSDTTQADDDADDTDEAGDLDHVVVRNPAKTGRVYANVGRLQPGETTTTTMQAAREHITAGELQVVTSRVR